MLFLGYSDVVAITFRPAELADIPALAAIRAREWETEAYWKNRIAGYLWGGASPQQALPGRTLIVALDGSTADGSTVVGFVAGHLTRRFGCDGELEWINVARENRGSGIARSLVREIGKWFVEQGARRICVDVRAE